MYSQRDLVRPPTGETVEFARHTDQSQIEALERLLSLIGVLEKKGVHHEPDDTQ